MMMVVVVVVVVVVVDVQVYHDWLSVERMNTWTR